MAVLRTAAAVVIAVTCTEAALQQPPRDGQPVRQTPAALLTQAHDHYKARQWERAVEKYEAALAAAPAQFTAWFFLAHSYDNLYKPGRAGDPSNDRHIHKAAEHYRNAADREPDPAMKKRALQYLVEAYGPQKLNDPASAEPILQQMIHMEPADLTSYFALSSVQEDEGRHEEAEQVLLRAKVIAPRDPSVYAALSAFYNRRGDFANTMAALHQAAEVEPNKAEPYQRLAVFYWDKAFRDQRISRAQKRAYVSAGIAATDRALAIDPDHMEALTYKGILLRMQANEEGDASARERLLAEAEALRERALEVGKTRAATHRSRRTPQRGGGGVPSAAPQPAGAGIDGAMPVRVGGNIPTPRRIKDAAPVYPETAFNDNVQGVVIIEATIDTAGRIADARVLRSIPLLDEAALQAVRQWEFEPTLLNGTPVPVIMTITVNFTRQ